jgi:hypothetical protein
MRVPIALILVTTRAFGQEVSTAGSHHESKPLRSIAPIVVPGFVAPSPRRDPERALTEEAFTLDAVRQAAPPPAVKIDVQSSFEGLATTSFPPDPTGAVGDRQYVQAINAKFAVFDKATGKVLHAGASIRTLWRGTKDLCETHGNGDPIVLYDKMAHRWIISQFITVGLNHECVAVSATDDATGAYHLYRFDYNAFPDYPKLATWPDAYYASFNMFSGIKDRVGSRACAYERDKMLVGAPASKTREVCFLLQGLYGQLPSDFDGGAAPPAGSPNYFLRRSGDGRHVDLRRFHVDWSVNPPRATFGVGATHAPDARLAVASFSDACPRTRSCVPQLATNQKLDASGDRLMFRNVYRRFSDHETLLINHTIASGSSVAVRWYEIRNPSGTPLVEQQGTFAPDGTGRFVASIGVDHVGNIAAGYTTSSASIHPGLKATARTPTTAPGLLGAETPLFQGPSSQPVSKFGFRWGDYSQITVDPSDECTFWYTGEYIDIAKALSHRTRIVSFRVNDCAPPAGTN